MKRLLFVAGACLVALTSFGQVTRLEYGLNFGGRVRFIDVDASGNVYVAGNHENDETFNGTTLPDNGNSNIFILKIDPDGTIEWAKGIGGPEYDEVLDIDVDDAGNVYIAGSFNDAVDFDPNIDEEPKTASLAAPDGFLLKLNTDGDFVWVRVIRGDDSAAVTGVATDGSSGVYLTGWFNGEADLDPTDGDQIAIATGTDAFFIKLNVDGTFGWAKSLGNSNFINPTAASVDFTGTPVFAGTFNSDLDMNPDSPEEIHTPVGLSNDVFLLKLGATDGTFLWGRNFGTDGDPTNVNSMRADGQNNIYLTGDFRGSGDFDPGSPETILTATDMSSDIFISKFHPSGALLWAHGIGGLGDDLGSGIYSDGSNVYTTGAFNANVDFDPGAGQSLQTAADDADIFILKLDGTGVFKSVIVLGDDSYDDGRDIMGDAAGNIYTTGGFSGSSSIDMDPSGCDLLLDPETDPSWVVMYGTAPPPCLSIITPPKGLMICAGSTPTVTFSVVASGVNLTYQWYTEDSEGEPIDIPEGGRYSGTQTSTMTVDVTGRTPGYDIRFAVEVSGDGYPPIMSGFVSFDVAALPVPIPATRCGAGVLTLKVEAAFGAQYRWYTDATGGSPIPGITGPSYTTPSLSVSTTYYVSRVLASCETDRVPIVAAIANCQPIPVLDWALSNAPHGRVADMYVDRATGTVYTTGYYTGSGLFDVASGTNITGYGSTDVFIAKYDANGTLLWVRGVGGTSQDDTNAITVDKDGNVIITGYFLNTGDFDPGPLVYPLTSAGSWDTFILKLNASGDFVWAKRYGSTPTNGDISGTVTTDAAGNIYVGGYFNGTVDMDPGAGTVPVTSSGVADGVILKLDKDGGYLNSYILRGAQYETINDIVVDAAGNIYSTGFYYTGTDFDPGTGTAIAAEGSNDTNAFIWKIKADGTLGWYKTFFHAGDRQDGASIDLDSEGNVIAGITYEGTVDFDPGTGVDVHTAVGNDPFVLKLDSNGNYIWAKTLPTGSGLGFGYAAVDGTDVYILGGFGGTMDADPGPGVFNLTDDGGGDAMIVKLNKDGNFQWGLHMGGPSLDFLMGMGFDNEGNIYVGGQLHSPGDYDPGPDEYILNPIANPAGTLVKLGKPSPVFNITLQPASASVCEGATASFSTAAAGGGTTSYLWQKFDGTDFVDLSDNATYSGTGTSVLSVNTTGNSGAGKYRCHIWYDGGSLNTNEVDLAIVTSIAAPTVGNTSRCGGGSITVTAAGSTDGNYRWFTSATGTALSGEVNSSYTANITATTTYYVSIVNGSCESLKASVTATINAIPPAPTTANITRCLGATVALTASGAATGEYRWYAAPTGGSALSSNDSFTTPALTGNTTYYVSAINTAGCESTRTPLVITATNCNNNQPPAITTTTSSTELQGSVNIDLGPLLSDPDNNLDLTTLKIVVQPKSGAKATIDQNGRLNVDYSSTTFEGEDELTVEVCDIAGVCARQTIKITVSGEVMVYNAVSPNGDGKNDVFHIAYIDVIAQTRDNKVTIFNRWGDVVFEVEDYNNTTNVFRGNNNKGNELPSGTYFYRIQYNSDRPAETGYISLKR
ncbi:MAG TPA: gliding motility-associated C-terminal domain-containing protein [Cyclobacteriaceae bacterium]|nr:gliding motility-associated C-terminal domain-containing protein [Cyclobacteriaceae bacterium]